MRIDVAISIWTIIIFHVFFLVAILMIKVILKSGSVLHRVFLNVTFIDCLQRSTWHSFWGSILGLRESLCQRENVLAQTNCLKHYFICYCGIISWVWHCRARLVIWKELFDQWFNNWQVQNLVTRGTVTGGDLKHKLYNRRHFLWKVLWNSWVLSFDNLFVETLHVVSSKRRDECTHFVQNTA
jgi:hypothetical protein